MALRVVTIGGGNGSLFTLSALKPLGHTLSAIVTMADDGGSAGVLRDAYDTPPMGDVRRGLIALASDDHADLRALMAHRFSGGPLDHHVVGNILLTALYQQAGGDLVRTVSQAAQMLGVTGEVIPVTLEKIRAHAELETGEIVHGENQIDVPVANTRAPIKRIFLTPEFAAANPAAIRVIHEADAVVIGPGDLYSSLVPALIVPGITDALRATRGKKIFLCSAMTKSGETDGYDPTRVMRVIDGIAGTDVIDLFLANTTAPSPSRLAKYANTGAQPLLAQIASGRIRGVDLLAETGELVYDQAKVAREILLALQQ